jgi:hypothetical protein
MSNLEAARSLGGAILLAALAICGTALIIAIAWFRYEYG